MKNLILILLFLLSSGSIFGQYDSLIVEKIPLSADEGHYLLVYGDTINDVEADTQKVCLQIYKSNICLLNDTLSFRGYFMRPPHYDYNYRELSLHFYTVVIYGHRQYFVNRVKIEFANDMLVYTIKNPLKEEEDRLIAKKKEKEAKRMMRKLK